jgi:hypothetical protein
MQRSLWRKRLVQPCEIEGAVLAVLGHYQIELWLENRSTSSLGRSTLCFQPLVNFFRTL